MGHAGARAAGPPEPRARDACSLDPRERPRAPSSRMVREVRPDQLEHPSCAADGRSPVSTPTRSSGRTEAAFWVTWSVSDSDENTACRRSRPSREARSPVRRPPRGASSDSRAQPTGTRFPRGWATRRGRTARRRACPDEREVAGQMVAFEPPAPRAGARRAEHRDVVEVGVERVADARVHALQDALERHDVELPSGSPTARCSRARAPARGAVVGRHLAERKPVPRHRRRHRPVPARALGARERERRPVPLAVTATRGRRAPQPRPPRRRRARRAPGALRSRGRRRRCGEPKGGRPREPRLEVVVVHVRPTSERANRPHQNALRPIVAHGFSPAGRTDRDTHARGRRAGGGHPYTERRATRLAGAALRSDRPGMRDAFG